MIVYTAQHSVTGEPVRAAIVTYEPDLDIAAAMVRHYEDCPVIILTDYAADAMHKGFDSVVMTRKYFCSFMVQSTQDMVYQTTDGTLIGTREEKMEVTHEYLTNRKVLSAQLNKACAQPFGMCDSVAYQHAGYYVDKATPLSEAPQMVQDLVGKYLP